MTDNIITLENLTKDYGEGRGIFDINLEIKQGECCGYVGTNGSGKTTTIRSIMGFLQPDDGRAYVKGMDAWQNAVEIKKHVSYVPGEIAFPSFKTGLDFLKTQAEYLGIKDLSYIHQLIDMFKLDPTADLSRMSKGMKQKTALVAAFMGNHEILILDEPTSYLDIRHKLELLNTLKKLVREKNIAVLMSLHELDLAERVSDKIVCIDGGKVGRVGTQEEIFSGGYISKLYGISGESFCESSGCAELERPYGKPDVFVISGGGNASGVFRRLQRQGVPFVTGIIPENDIDYPVAKALAVKVLSCPAFSRATESALQRGKALVSECGHVICCPGSCGELNPENSVLLKYAQELGKIER